MRSSLDPRQSMAHLPAVLQPLLTWLTGKPLPGQRPLFSWTAWTRLLPNTAQLAAGLALTAWVVPQPPAWWLLLPVAWVLTGGALRGLYLELAHNAVHHAFTHRPLVDRWVTEILTTITLTNGYDVFRRQHVALHHGRTATPDDPDFAALLCWGFRPGTALHTLRRRAWSAMVDPRVHGGYLLGRLRDNFARGPRYRRAMAIVWNAALVAATVASPSPTFVLLGWLVPLVWAFQVSSLLQMLAGEHRWGRDLGTGRERMMALTHGRMLGDVWPQTRRADARVRWWMRLLLWHLPARLFVFVGNDIGPAHDLHHRRPKSDWANAIYARQALIDAGEFGPHEDVWGSLGDHIAMTLGGLAQGPGLAGRAACPHPADFAAPR